MGISCWSSNFSGDRCLQCTRCNSCPGVGREKDTMSNAVESIFSRGEGGTSEESGNENKIMGERMNRHRRTLNSQFGYTHSVSKETAFTISMPSQSRRVVNRNGLQPC